MESNMDKDRKSTRNHWIYSVHTENSGTDPFTLVNKGTAQLDHLHPGSQSGHKL